MDKRLLDYYERELRFLKESGEEFAKMYPGIARFLSLEDFLFEDPYVKLFLESFAYGSARTHYKLDVEFSNFIQQLLQIVYPGYLSPVPSMAVVQMQPKFDAGPLREGFVIPSGSRLLSQVVPGRGSACEFRTAHEVTLWPVEIAEADYASGPRSAAKLGLATRTSARACLRLLLRTTAGVTLDQLPMERLAIYLRGGEVAAGLYEQLVGNTIEITARPAKHPSLWSAALPPIRPLGLEDDESLLPSSARSFGGYRLLREYFAFPERFLFIELSGLKQVVSRCRDNELELIFLFKRHLKRLDEVVSASHFALFCTPAANVFRKRADPIHPSTRAYEYHIVPDRTRPMDFEVYGVAEVLGFGNGADPTMRFLPFYQVKDSRFNRGREAYYSLTRQPHRPSSRQKDRQFVGRRGPGYSGSEVFMMLSDSVEPPYPSDLKRLGIEILCTNRDLPLRMPVGKGESDFMLVAAAPVQAVRCIDGPTSPKPSAALGKIAWRLISHLS